MEDKELLKQITYWSQLINSQGSQQRPQFKTSTVQPRKREFNSRYSKVNSAHHSYNENSTYKSTVAANSRYSLVKNNTLDTCPNDTKPLTVTNVLNPSPSKTVYVNKSIMLAKANAESEGIKKKHGIYFNPNFVQLPTVNRTSTCYVPAGPDQLKARVPDTMPQSLINRNNNCKENTVLINPAFVKKLNGSSASAPVVGGDRVYVNPKFFKPESSSVNRPVTHCDNNPPASPKNNVQINTVIKHSSNEQVEKARGSKLVISKHKLIRRRSGSFTNGLKHVSQKIINRNLKTVGTYSPISKKYKVNNKLKNLLLSESLKGPSKPIPKVVSSVLQQSGKNKEFHGSKYSIVRRKSNSNILDNSVHSSNSKTPARVRRNSVKSAALLQQQVGRRRSLSNSISSQFQVVGKTKLVRKSILQSHIIARRSLTNSRYKYLRNIINCDKKIVHPQISPVLKRTSVLRSKFKIISRPAEYVNPVKKYPRAKNVFHPSPKNNRSIVNISGILYRSSRNKLTRRDIPKGIESSDKIIRVGGVKFRLNRNGRTLRRLRKDSLNMNSKVDIGKLTSVNLSTNAQNNLCTSRLRLRQRSLAILTAKLRKCNQPCLFYNRFGYCKRKENSTCEKVHDPKLVSVCKKFLKGECSNEKCLMSHSLVPEKMPICHHFLKGGCMRDNCPYLHVKHNSKTPICLLFLDGYCPNASTCNKRHEYACPVFSERGECPKGQRCTYPHPARKDEGDGTIRVVGREDGSAAFKHRRQSWRRVVVKNTEAAKESEIIKAEVSNVRYFIRAQELDGLPDGGQENRDSSFENDIILVEDSDDEQVPNLDTSPMPNYIPLNQSV